MVMNAELNEDVSFVVAAVGWVLFTVPTLSTAQDWRGRTIWGTKKQKLTRLRFRTVGICWKWTKGGGTD